MHLRKIMALLSVLSMVALAAPVAASAATPHAVKSESVANFKNVPVSGTFHNKTFTGHMNISQFVTRHGKTFALGTLTGRIGNRSIRAEQVAVPAALPASTTSTSMRSYATTSCPILHLVLGPLNLNLLGLHVTLNQVVLNITAQSGPGNLLGNLLCSVSNLLNGGLPSGSPLGNLAGLLNLVNTLTATPTLLGL